MTNTSTCHPDRAKRRKGLEKHWTRDFPHTLKMTNTSTCHPDRAKRRKGLEKHWTRDFRLRSNVLLRACPKNETRTKATLPPLPSAAPMTEEFKEIENRVGRETEVFLPTRFLSSHTTVRAVRHTAV